MSFKEKMKNKGSHIKKSMEHLNWSAGLAYHTKAYQGAQWAHKNFTKYSKIVYYFMLLGLAYSLWQHNWQAAGFIFIGIHLHAYMKQIYYNQKTMEQFLLEWKKDTQSDTQVMDSQIQ